MSITISGLVLIIGSLLLIPEGELQTVLEAIGVIVSWIGRYRLGGINAIGVRK